MKGVMLDKRTMGKGEEINLKDLNLSKKKEYSMSRTGNLTISTRSVKLNSVWRLWVEKYLEEFTDKLQAALLKILA